MRLRRPEPSVTVPLTGSEGDACGYSIGTRPPGQVSPEPRSRWVRSEGRRPSAHWAADPRADLLGSSRSPGPQRAGAAEKRVPLPFLQHGRHFQTKPALGSAGRPLHLPAGRRARGAAWNSAHAVPSGAARESSCCLSGPLLETAGSSGTFPVAQAPCAACQLLHAHPVPAAGPAPHPVSLWPPL